MKKLLRRNFAPPGFILVHDIHICTCTEKKRKGKKGGTCNTCGGAIPTDQEIIDYQLN